jgi:hypothetical protein
MDASLVMASVVVLTFSQASLHLGRRGGANPHKWAEAADISGSSSSRPRLLCGPLTGCLDSPRDLLYVWFCEKWVCLWVVGPIIR